MDWTKLKPFLVKVLQFLLVLLTGAGGGAAYNAAQPAQPKAFAAAPTPKRGADYAVIVNFGLKNKRGLPGPVCYSETVVFTLRSDIADLSYLPLKKIDREVNTLMGAAFSNLCDDKQLTVSMGGAMPYGYYGDLYPVIRWDGSPEAINPELPTK